MANMATDDPKRLQNLEFVLTHLQKSYDELSLVVFNQQKEIELLRQSVSKLNSGLQSLAESDRSPRSLADDRPPHY
jgi:uncharacterized coiled-coil protein SlyX